MTPGWLSRIPEAKDVHFDIDDYLNRIVPPSPVHRLPAWISRFLGHREKPRADVGNILVAFWALVGAFVGLVVVGALFKFSPTFWDQNPLIFGSLGAAAVLEYNAIQAPLAQPRQTVLGHVICAAVGVGISKLFQMDDNFLAIRWIAGPLACGVASAVMTMTGSVYPPGGATAVLAVTDPSVVVLGWTLVPMVLVAALIMLGVALLVNNIQRRYPIYWWTPREVGLKRWHKQPKDLETLGSEKTLAGSVDFGSNNPPTAAQEALNHSIVIGIDGMSLPSDFTLEEEELAVLNQLLIRLQYSPAQNTRSYGDRGHEVYRSAQSEASPTEKDG